jgi:hypothetical protein
VDLAWWFGSRDASGEWSGVPGVLAHIVDRRWPNQVDPQAETGASRRPGRSSGLRTLHISPMLF